jgi:5-methylcytosine-specific restriction endonuclease McrA
MNGEPFRAPLVKPEPRKRTKARRKRKQAKDRTAARKLTLERSRFRCERCGVPVCDFFPPWHAQRAHVNEKVPRSLGGSAVDLTNLELLCRMCHLPNGQHAPTAARQAFILNRGKP